MATGGALIGALRVTLGLDSANFEAGTKRARQTAQRDASAIQKSLDGLKGRLDTLYAGVAGSAILAAGKRALDYASSLGEVAQQAGVSAKELQEYRYAASQAGVSTEQMDGALTKLTKTIGEAKAGSKAQATTFRELGVAIQDANGRVYSAGEVIPKLADALAKVKDPATRARLEMELFGKTGQKLDTLLAGGSEALNNLRDAAHKLGVVLSDRQIQNADDAADKLASVKQVLEARIAGVVSDNATAIVSLADALGTLTARFIQFAQSNPEKTLGLIGAAAGALRGGVVGAGIGFVGGSMLGRNIGQSSADANMDIKFRKAELARARSEYQAREKASKSGGILSFRRTGSGQPGGTVAQAEAELRRQTSLLMQAAAAAGRPAGAIATPVPDGALPTVASTGGGRKKGQSGPTAAEIEAKHQQELSRLRQDALQAELQLTTDAEKRADLQSQLLLEEFNERSAQIANDEHFTVDQKAAQKAALKALYGVSGEGENIIVGGNKNSLSDGLARDLQEQLAREAFAVRSADLEAQRDNLQGQLNLARTADERRKIDLEILDLEYKLREAKLDQVTEANGYSKAESDLAAMARSRLAGQRVVDGASVERQNMGPMATYLDSLPKTAGEVNEAFEQIAANGLANMNDQLANAAANTLKLKGLAGQLFNQLIADVIRLNLQQAMGGGGSLLGGLLKIGGSIFGGGNGLGGVSSSSMDSINAQVAGLSSKPLPGLATGGTIGGLPGIDNNVLSINGIPTARVSANERIRVEPNSANDNGGRGGVVRLEVVEGALFRPVVTQISGGVSAQTVASAAPSISGGTQKAIGRANSRRLA